MSRFTDSDDFEGEIKYADAVEAPEIVPEIITHDSDVEDLSEDIQNVVNLDEVEDEKEDDWEEGGEEDEQDNSCADVIQIEKDIILATVAKEEGNAFFRTKDYDSAISSYSRAVTLCPTDDEHKETLSVFLGNRAAAYFSVDEYDCVIDDCTSSLELNSNYVKVLMRRSQAYEKLTRPEDALVDAKKVQELDSQFPKINSTVKRLEIESEERMTKMKDEALGKLKQLGNSILGNFGMSLDSFNMKQDEKTGSWNISMGNK